MARVPSETVLALAFRVGVFRAPNIPPPNVVAPVVPVLTGVLRVACSPPVAYLKCGLEATLPVSCKP
jgi:hypothetical protein